MQINEYYHPKTYSPKSKKSSKKPVVLGLVIALLMLGGLVFWLSNKNTNQSNPQQSQQTAQTPPTSENNTDQATKPQFNSEGLQATIENWTASNSGTYSVAVVDLGTYKELANYQGNKQYFTASIYKLYVVYLAYQDVDSGKTKLTDIVSAGRNRKECLDAAIRSSDSPCGEALLKEIGSQNVNTRLKSLGLSSTNFPGFVTTPLDADIILQKLYKAEGLSSVSTQAYLDSMKIQPEKYRLGTPKGVAGDGVVVANKVGWSETPHYHDTAIVYLPDGRAYALVIFSQGAKVDQVADLARTINQHLTKI